MHALVLCHIINNLLAELVQSQGCYRWTWMNKDGLEADDVSLVHPSVIPRYGSAHIQTKKELESYPKVQTSHSLTQSIT